jgi:hypothetical protein
LHTFGISTKPTLVEGPILDRTDLPLAEGWGILALQVLAVASLRG